MAAKANVVYVVGAGLSVGLGFPTIATLLPDIWGRLESAGLSDDLAEIVRFHHPDFNPLRRKSYPNIEQLLSEMQANEQLFDSTRAATGKFTSEQLLERRRNLLWQITDWFHEIKANAFHKKPNWLLKLAERIRDEHAQVISFNWDLVLDELLFGKDIDKSSYGFGERNGVRLLKPHGSLNWYSAASARFLKADKKFLLASGKNEEIFVFRPFRAPKSNRREYSPLIVPPVYAKQFDREVFKSLWREVVAVLSVATEVRFIGFSLAPADFHARFTLRCGFHNQEDGIIRKNGNRSRATGRAHVIVVDKNKEAHRRIEDCVGWRCSAKLMTVESWVDSW